MRFLLLSLSLYVLSVDTILPPPPPPPAQTIVGAFNCVWCWGKPECTDESSTSICPENQCRTVITNLVGEVPSMTKNCNSAPTFPLGCSTQDMGGGSNMTTCVCTTDMCNKKGFVTAAGCIQPVPPVTTTSSKGIGVAAGTTVAAGSGTAIQAKIGNSGEAVNPTFLISMISTFLILIVA